MSILEAPDAPFRLTTPIEHITKLDDGTLLVHCVVTSEAPDSQGEIIDYDAFKEAAPGLMKWAVLGENHDPERMDAGTILKLYFDDAARRVEADVHVVDPVAVKKVLARVYKMVSIGGVASGSRRESIGGHVYRRLTKFVADHLALVPRGANPEAMIAKQFVIAKRGPDMLDTVDAGMASPLSEVTFPDRPQVVGPASIVLNNSDPRTPEQVTIDETRAALAKAADGPPEGGVDREDIPAEDFAGKDKSYPIVTPGSVSDAASSIGRAGPDNYSSDELKANIIRIATRKGPAFVAELPKAWRKDTRKMAKAAAAAAEAAPESTPEPVTETIVTIVPEPVAKAETEKDAADGDGPAAKPPFPGAKAPFKGKKAARKAAKVAKAAEREAADADLVKAYTTADDPTALAVRRLAKQAARAGKLAKANAKLRKDATAMRKERRELRKASVLTEVLTKTGARNSKADMAKIDAIHEATVELGTTTHVVAQPMAALPDATAAVDTPLAKSAAPLDARAIMREALQDVGLAPGRIDAIEARVIALDEKSGAQGDQLARIAKTSSGGGPATGYAPIFRGLPEGEVTDKATALAKAASVVDDPRLKTQLTSLSAEEQIRMARQQTAG